MSAISVRHVWVEYGDQIVLERINLEIASGSFLSVVGPPGAGGRGLSLAPYVPAPGDVLTVTVKAAPWIPVEPAAPPTELQAKLASETFVVTVEMEPPRSFNAAELVAAAETLADAGADAIDVADSPMAKMRSQ